MGSLFSNKNIESIFVVKNEVDILQLVQNLSRYFVAKNID